MPVPWFRVSVTLALVGAAPPAAAQMFSTLTQDLMQTRMLLKPVEDLAGRNRARTDALSAPSHAPNGPPAVHSLPPRAVTSYAVSPEVRQRVRTQFVDWMKANTPNLPPAAEAQLRRADFVSDWAKAVREDGLKPGDAADALAAYWLLNWMMANGRQSNTPAEAQSVRDQTRDLLQANTRFAALGDAHKQEMAEVWMMNFLLQGNAYFDAIKRGDSVLAEKLGEAATARFRNEMGVELPRLRLTPAGFTGLR